MSRASRNIRRLAGLVAISALVAFDATIANHFILPCRDECTNPRWVVTGSLATARDGHTATLLPSGKVLVAGGCGGVESALLDSAELYDPATGTWSLAGRMSMPRIGHTATLLPDGRVLVAGGDTPGGSPEFGRTSTAEIYDPGTGTWISTSRMTHVRSGHAAVRLPDGSVLVAGGYYLETIDSAELYDADTRTWSSTGSLNDGRYWHTMTVLRDGRVLAARGSDDGDLQSTLTTAETYDSANGTWTFVPESTLSGVFHTATLLPDGRVLFAGGCCGGDSHGVVDASSELFDPASGGRDRAGDLLTRRFGLAAALLPDGSVLIAGGSDTIRPVPNFRTMSLSSVERFDPRAGTWSAAAELNIPRTGHTMTVLADGTVLVAGGHLAPRDGEWVALASAERYVIAARPAQGAVPPRSGRTLDPAQASRVFTPAP